MTGKTPTNAYKLYAEEVITKPKRLAHSKTWSYMKTRLLCKRGRFDNEVSLRTRGLSNEVGVENGASLKRDCQLLV